MAEVSVSDLLEAGTHFGHQTHGCPVPTLVSWLVSTLFLALIHTSFSINYPAEFKM